MFKRPHSSSDVSGALKRYRAQESSDMYPNGRFPMRKAYKGRPKTSKNFAKAVRKVVERTEELKETQFNFQATNLPPSNASSWTSSSMQISPGTSGFQIFQGPAQGERIGNQIRTRKAWVRGVMHIMPYDASVNSQPIPTEVRMLIFKDKFNRTSRPSAVAIDLFQQGSTSIGPQNDLVDMILDVNRDRYQVYHDQILKVGTSAYAGTGTLPSFQSFANNDFSLNAKFNVDITKFLPSVVQYNDNTSQPMSDSLWMIFLPVQAGGGQFGSTQVTTQMSWVAGYSYTDA